MPPTEAVPAESVFPSGSRAVWVEDLPTAALQQVPVPLPPADRHARGWLKRGSGQATEEDGEKGGGPGRPAAEAGRDCRPICKAHDAAPPHPEAGLPTDCVAYDKRARPQFKPDGLAAGSANGQEPASHPAAGQAANIPRHHHETALHPVLAARAAATDVVARPPRDPDPSASQFCGQPVAGIPLHVESAPVIPSAAWRPMVPRTTT